MSDSTNAPVTMAFLRPWLGYSAWATQHVLAVCATLDAEELSRDLGCSHVSILGTLRHMYYAERVWLNRLRDGAMPPLHEVGDQRLFQDAAPEPELADLRQRWPAIWEGFDRYCDGLGDAALAETIRGPDWGMKRWELMVHAVNHSTIHRGQVVGMVRQLGKQPPNTDVFGFYFTAQDRATVFAPRS